MHLPQTTYKQRQEFYEDIETLVSVGFLTHPVTLRGTQISLRTLCPGDMFLLRARIGLNEGSWAVQTVASSIWMVDGHCVMGDPNTHPN
mgnify:FL=1